MCTLDKAEYKTWTELDTAGSAQMAYLAERQNGKIAELIRQKFKLYLIYYLREV